MASHPIADGLEVLEVAETSGSAAGGLDAALDRLDGGRSDAMGVVGEDAIPMAFEGLGQFLEGCQTAAHRPRAPRLEMDLGAGCSGPFPSVLKVLSERPGTAEFLVPGTEVVAQLELRLIQTALIATQGFLRSSPGAAVVTGEDHQRVFFRRFASLDG